MDSIEIPSGYKQGSIPTSLLTITQEQAVLVKKENKIIRIGIPKESSIFEKRVPLTPSAVATLVARGCEIYIEHNAGINAQFSDKDYSQAGAFIAFSTAEVINKSDVIIKIQRPNEEELTYFRPKQVLISAISLGSVSVEYIKSLLAKNITAISFEYMKAEDGNTPIMQMMSEIAGITSIHIAAELLSHHRGGQGLLLGGITGVPPAVVTILGAGTVGLNAARSAIALGATIKVIDSEIYKLRALEDKLGQKVYTSVSQSDYIEEAVISSDLVIGAAYKPGRRTPLLVSEDTVIKMKEGSVIIDISIDQGGCFETSRITSHDNPTYIEHGIIHYCVPNIASRVPKTGSAALSNIIAPVLAKLADFGNMNALINNNMLIKNGVYVHQKHLTQRTLSQMFGIDYVDVNLLFAGYM